MRKLHAKNRGLQGINPKIRTDELVVIFHLSAVLANRAKFPRKRTVGGRHEAGISKGAQVLRRKKRKATDRSDAADRFAAVTCADRLGRVLDDRNSGAL